ncbi:MAG: phage tail protein [Desulfobacteraceae bacterium]|nr:phage tail protein [Desulfobacteraceae bacterium]
MPEQFLHGIEVLNIDTGSRPIQTAKSSVIGVVGTAPGADAEKFPLNMPVLVSSRSQVAKLDPENLGQGSLYKALNGIFDQTGALVVVVRVAKVVNDTETLTNILGGVDAQSGQYLGVHALLGSESVLGVSPRIICVPGFTHQRTANAANAVVSELIGIAERLKAVIIADGPNSTDQEAIDYARDFDSSRVFVADPWVLAINSSGVPAPEPASARIAGLIAKTDNEKGFWWSPSNNNINGIVGTARAVDFTLGDANSRANLLNENKIATIIRQDGYRLWGNRTLSSDTKWAFLSVRRTADVLYDSLLRNHLWAVDRNITKTYVQDVVEGVNAYIRSLVSKGALLGGECWADQDLNTPANVQAGKVYFNFDFTPPYPAEHIVFRSQLVNDYIKEVFV